MEEIIQRLTDLEVHSSYQDQLIEELNQIVTECNLQVQRLIRENSSLKEMVNSLAPDLPESPDE